jgi:ribonuclease HI
MPSGLDAPRELARPSASVVGWLAEGWKRHNPILAARCRELDELRAVRAAQGGSTVTFKGHSGGPLNERADALATGA